MNGWSAFGIIGRNEIMGLTPRLPNVPVMQLVVRMIESRSLESMRLDDSDRKALKERWQLLDEKVVEKGRDLLRDDSQSSATD